MYTALQHKLEDIARRLDRLSHVKVSFDVDGDEDRCRFSVAFDVAANEGSGHALDEIEETLADIVGAMDVENGERMLQSRKDIARVQARGKAGAA